MRVVLLVWFAVVAACAPAVGWAGALWRGYCYSSTLDASNAWCAELSQQVGGIGGAGVSLVQTSVSTGRLSDVYLTGAVGAYCSTVPVVSGQTMTVTWTTAGGFSKTSGGNTTGTGYTYPSGSNVGGSIGSNSAGRSITFPSCDASFSTTVGDQVAAINTLFAPALAMLAVIWGGKQVFNMFAVRREQISDEA